MTRQMLMLTPLCGMLFLFAYPARAQDDNVPPTFTGVGYTIDRNIGGDTLFGPYLFNQPFDPTTDLARELDIVNVTVAIFDPDFHKPGNTNNTCDDHVWFRLQAGWFPPAGYLAPEPPPVPETSDTFCCADGFCPPTGETVFLTVSFTIPQFLGRSQAHLRGLPDEFGNPINWDARYAMFYEASNSQSPDETVPGTFVAISDLISCEHNPAIKIPNPQAFADAGPDLTVESGTTVLLDGTKTFDSFNVGFNPRSQNVIEKDNITFSWEFVSGPEGVTPLTRDPVNNPAVAEVTLNAIGTYIYRLTADDGVNALPTMDSTTIEVVSTIPENRAPIARIKGPSGPLVLGALLTLDGTSSVDPDGDQLTFRWQQTNEVGGNLATDENTTEFQPLSGLDSPIATWQAVNTGTFYFRLLVDDGQAVSSSRISVTIIDAAAEAAVVRADSKVRQIFPADQEQTSGQETTSTTASDSTSQTSGGQPACGLGSALPLAVVPIALWFARRR